MDAQPIRMRGKIEGGSVFVTDDIELPDDCKVYVQIVPAVHTKMTRKELAELEAFYSEMYGRPVILFEEGVDDLDDLL